MFEDAQLVNRLKNGDREALCRIYRKYGDSLLAMAQGILRDQGLAEDVLHDVFLAFVRDIYSFVLTGKLKHYLARCVAHRAIDVMRSRKDRPVDLDQAEPVRADTPLPQQDAVRREEIRKVDQALGQLPAEQRQVIMMHIHGQMRFRQIALCQGVSINTIQGRYQYGMNKLKAILQG